MKTVFQLILILTKSVRVSFNKPFLSSKAHDYFLEREWDFFMNDSRHGSETCVMHAVKKESWKYPGLNRTGQITHFTAVISNITQLQIWQVRYMTLKRWKSFLFIVILLYLDLLPYPDLLVLFCWFCTFWFSLLYSR